MIEAYCDGSYKPRNSHIGCLVLRDGIQIHESTTKIDPSPRDIQICEEKAIELAKKLSTRIAEMDEDIIIYNDRSGAVTANYSARIPEKIHVKQVSRDDKFQWIADKLSKGFYNGLTSYYPYTDKAKINENKVIEIYYGYYVDIYDNLCIGCVLLKNGEKIHQSTTKTFHISKGHDKEGVVLEFIRKVSEIIIEEGYKVESKDNSKEQNPRKDVEELSKGFMYYDRIMPDFPCKKEIYPFRELINQETDLQRSVFVCISGHDVSNKYIHYKLTIFSPEKFRYEKDYPDLRKGGKGTHCEIAEKVKEDLSNPEFQLFLKSKGIQLDNSYFVLTEKMTGFRINKWMAASILPESIEHKIIDLGGLPLNYLFETFKGRIKSNISMEILV